MATTNWVLDPTHSEIGFKVRHMMITNVSGSFASFEVEVKSSDEQFSSADLRFSADVNSISTGSDQRDGHLKSADFFETEKYPELVFEAKGYSPQKGEHSLKGNMTIKGITKPVEFKVEFGGIAKDPWGNTKAGFTISGKINRKDFGLTWNAATEAGGVLVGEEVKLLAEIQLTKS